MKRRLLLALREWADAHLAEDDRDPYDDDHAEAGWPAGPSTYTCRDCDLVLEVWHTDAPYLGPDDPRLLCEHMRVPSQISRIDGLRYG